MDKKDGENSGTNWPSLMSELKKSRKHLYIATAITVLILLLVFLIIVLLIISS